MSDRTPSAPPVNPNPHAGLAALALYAGARPEVQALLRQDPEHALSGGVSAEQYLELAAGFATAVSRRDRLPPDQRGQRPGRPERRGVA